MTSTHVPQQPFNIDLYLQMCPGQTQLCEIELIQCGERVIVQRN